VLLGAMRELLGNGTLLANMHLLFGDMAQSWTITIPDYKKFLFFILPPSAFICLGFIIAAKNIIDEQLKTTPNQTKINNDVKRAVNGYAPQDTLANDEN
jgi:electron transport complex protein RnfE